MLKSLFASPLLFGATKPYELTCPHERYQFKLSRANGTAVTGADSSLVKPFSDSETRPLPVEFVSRTQDCGFKGDTRDLDIQESGRGKFGGKGQTALEMVTPLLEDGSQSSGPRGNVAVQWTAVSSCRSAVAGPWLGLKIRHSDGSHPGCSCHARMGLPLSTQIILSQSHFRIP